MTDIQKQLAEALTYLLDDVGRASSLPGAIKARAALAAHRQQEARGPLTWQPIETAPKDGTPILGWCVHGADLYFDEAANRLTDYGARAEGLSHVEDGAHVLVWGEAYEESDGWESGSYTVPAWWALSTDPEVMANPTHWAPIPPTPDAAHGIKGE